MLPYYTQISASDLAAQTDGAWLREQVDKTLAWYLNWEHRYQAYRES